jgi:hypothetical protein
MAANTARGPIELPGEELAQKLDELFQDAYDALEGVACELAVGDVVGDLDARRFPPVTLEDIGALVVVCDRVDVQLEQSRRMLESLRHSIVQLVTMRAEQQSRLARGETP